MKTWLITGFSSGLGKSLAWAVLKKGGPAVVTARNAETLARRREEYVKRRDFSRRSDFDGREGLL